MSSIEQENRRNAFRIPVAPEWQHGELRFPGWRLPIKVVDESASGFAIVALESPPCSVGEIGQLRMRDQWYGVRIANIFPIQQWANGPIEESLAHSVRIGLFRLREIPDPDYKLGKDYWRYQWAEMRPLIFNGGTFSFLLLFFLVIGLSMPLTLMVVQAHKPMSETITNIGKERAPKSSVRHEAKKADASPADAAAPTKKDEPFAAVREYAKNMIDSSGSPPPSSSATAVTEEPKVSAFDNLQKSISQGLTPDVFRTSDFSEVFQLSQEQQTRLRELVDEASDATTSFQNALKNATARELATAKKLIAEDLFHDVYLMLTEDQQERWKSLFSGDEETADTPVEK